MLTKGALQLQYRTYDATVDNHPWFLFSEALARSNGEEEIGNSCLVRRLHRDMEEGHRSLTAPHQLTPAGFLPPNFPLLRI